MKLLIKMYALMGVNTSGWNICQLLFGKHYLGAIILIGVVLIISC